MKATQTKGERVATKLQRLQSKLDTPVPRQARKQWMISIGAGKVSIVIPCYNQGAMLREALASVEQVRMKICSR